MEDNGFKGLKAWLPEPGEGDEPLFSADRGPGLAFRFSRDFDPEKPSLLVRLKSAWQAFKYPYD